MPTFKRTDPARIYIIARPVLHYGMIQAADDSGRKILKLKQAAPRAV